MTESRLEQQQGGCDLLAAFSCLHDDGGLPEDVPCHESEGDQPIVAVAHAVAHHRGVGHLVSSRLS